MNVRRLLAAALVASVTVFATHAAPARRVVTLGGDVTEIVYALGAGGRVVCDDQSSLYPIAATKLPRVGYVRMLAAEGVLSCKPDLIIASQDAGPAAAVAQLESSGVRMVRVTNAHSPDTVLVKIGTIADAMGIPQRGAAMQVDYHRRLAAARARVMGLKGRPRALFLMAQGPGGAMAAGRGSAADAMLTLAGARNVAGGFDGYKPLTPEAAIALRPDVIIVADQAERMLGGRKALLARPEIAMTPAGKDGRVVAMDTLLLLGFGPRTPNALLALAAALHGSSP